jgi:hypothetical protein
MNEAPLHAYELIPLNIAGYVLAFALIVGHLFALVQGDKCRQLLVQSPRNHVLAQATLAIGVIWFFLLVAPTGLPFHLSSLRVELAEFESIRWLLQLACPVFFFLMVTQVRDLLFPRALGLVAMLAVAPFLTSAYLKEPTTRLLIPIWGYVVVILSMIWVGKPYIYRDMVNWITARKGLWNILCIGGLLYGVAILVCDILFW